MMSQCKHFRIRSEKYQKYFYCLQLKKRINVEKCSTCEFKNYKSQKKWKTRSKKLSKLERQRDKNLIKSGKCDYCHKEFKHLDPHEIYGGSNRARSIKYGFVKKLCRKCHSNEEIIRQLKIDTQKEFEKTHTREEFIKIIGKSYL